MKFSDLKLLEPSLVALKGDPDQFKIESISHSDAPQKNTFIFVMRRLCFKIQFITWFFFVMQKFFTNFATFVSVLMTDIFGYFCS